MEIEPGPHVGLTLDAQSGEAVGPPDDPDQGLADWRTTSVAWRRVGYVGEAILLIIVGVLFAYFLWASLTDRWNTDSSRLPLLTVAVGIPLYFVRIHQLVFGRDSERSSQRMIMDIGFDIGKEAEAELRRFKLFVMTFLGLIVSIAVIGFHIALPAWVALYLRRLGGVRWRWSILTGLGFLAFIYIVFDYFVPTGWHQPYLFQLLGIEYSGLH